MTCFIIRKIRQFFRKRIENNSSEDDLMDPDTPRQIKNLVETLMPGMYGDPVMEQAKSECSLEAVGYRNNSKYSR